MKKILFIFSIIGLLAVGCNSSSTTRPVVTQPSAGQPTSGQPQSGAVNVTISNFAFSPAVITIKKGTRVTWVNQDSTGHTVTGDSGAPASSTLTKGNSYSFTFNQSGTFSYHCSIHSSMTGSVTVTE